MQLSKFKTHKNPQFGPHVQFLSSDALSNSPLPVTYLLPLAVLYLASSPPLRDGLLPLLINILSLATIFASSYSSSAFKGSNDSAFKS
jgi:hypothetical protein